MTNVFVGVGRSTRSATERHNVILDEMAHLRYITDITKKEVLKGFRPAGAFFISLMFNVFKL